MLAGASIESSTHRVQASADSVDPAVASYASQYAVSEAEATQRLDRIRPIHDVLAAIRDAEPRRVAGWGIDHGSRMVGWVLLTGDAAVGATAQPLAAAHPDIELRTGAVHTYDELLAAQRSFDGGQGIRTVDHSQIISYTAVDMRANALEIGIDPAQSRADGSQATDAELRTKLAQVTADYTGSLGTKFQVADGRGISDNAMFDAGRSMSTCTSGFVAQEDGGGDYVVITAGHCRNQQKMHGVSLPWIRGYMHANADAQSHRIPGGAGHWARSQYKKASGIEQIHNDVARSGMINDHVCHTGRSSGVTCGTVRNINFQPTNSGACGSATCNAVFVRVEGPALKACKGDSGGPWWRYRTAYGIHKGGNDVNDTCTTADDRFAYFSAVHEVEDYLDVQVLEDTYIEVP